MGEGSLLLSDQIDQSSHQEPFSHWPLERSSAKNAGTQISKIMSYTIMFFFTFQLPAVSRWRSRRTWSLRGCWFPHWFALGGENIQLSSMMAPFLSIMLTVMNVISKSYFAKNVFFFSFKASEDDLLRRKSLTFIDHGRDAKKTSWLHSFPVTQVIFLPDWQLFGKTFFEQKYKNAMTKRYTNTILHYNYNFTNIPNNYF